MKSMFEKSKKSCSNIEVFEERSGWKVTDVVRVVKTEKKWPSAEKIVIGVNENRRLRGMKNEE